MSLDSDLPPSPSAHRDWFFPSSSFPHRPNPLSGSKPRNPRNLPLFPSSNRTPKPFIPDTRSQKTVTSRSFSSSSSSSSILRRDVKYAGIQRKLGPPSRFERTQKSDATEVVLGKKMDVGKGWKGFLDAGSKVRWKLAMSVAVSRIKSFPLLILVFSFSFFFFSSFSLVRWFCGWFFSLFSPLNLLFFFDIFDVLLHHLVEWGSVAFFFVWAKRRIYSAWSVTTNIQPSGSYKRWNIQDSTIWLNEICSTQ